jgi:DNA-binding CsgD family transcriptional regulator
MTEIAMLESLAKCRSMEDLHAATQTLVKKIGFEYFIYGVQVNTSITQPYRFIFSGYPHAWRDHYVKQGYLEKDPTVLGCIRDRRVVPMIWNAESFAETADSKRLFDEAQESGVGGGVSVYVQGGRGEAAMLSVATPSDPKKARRDVMGTLGRVQLLGCYLHEAVQRVVLSKEVREVKAAPLTARERECLVWAAEGKTAWEIGNIISVAERTVNFHLQNAAHKLGVTSRQHAVARAISMGIVAP